MPMTESPCLVDTKLLWTPRYRGQELKSQLRKFTENKSCCDSITDSKSWSKSVQYTASWSTPMYIAQLLCKSPPPGGLFISTMFQGGGLIERKKLN